MVGIPLNITVQNLDHLGLVAGIIDELKLVELIDHHLGTHPQQKVSPGQAFKAMILNGLGFVSAPLYLYAEFFRGKATQHLLGNGIEPHHLNDDVLGRTLDKIFKFGVSRLFSLIAVAAFEIFALTPKSYHLDSSSFALEGKDYSSESADGEPCVVNITHGYSRDHRPDLKQFMVDMVCSSDGGVPLALNLGNGNQSDQKVHAQRIQQFQKQWQVEGLFVADAALYSADNLEKLKGLKWLTRVPLTLNAAQEWIGQFQQQDLQETGVKGYRCVEACLIDSEVHQRWVMFESSAQRKSDLKTLEKTIERGCTQNQQALKKLSAQEFECRDDALKQGQALGKNWRYHTIEQLEVTEKKHYAKSGRPKSGEVPQRISYHVSGQVVQKPEAIALARNKAGRFILATSVLEAKEKEATAKALLETYKEQQYSERGWRFLKDPLFFASSLFLKSTRRIMALMMVMAVCLMVYTLAERKLRSALKLQGETLPDQRGKPTATPTIRWVFQCFQAIHWLQVDGLPQVLNLRDLHLKVLRLLGPPCQKYYLLI